MALLSRHQATTTRRELALLISSRSRPFWLASHSLSGVFGDCLNRLILSVCSITPLGNWAPERSVAGRKRVLSYRYEIVRNRGLGERLSKCHPTSAPGRFRAKPRSRATAASREGGAVWRYPQRPQLLPETAEGPLKRSAGQARDRA